MNVVLISHAKLDLYVNQEKCVEEEIILPPPAPVHWDPSARYFGTAQGPWGGEPFELECNKGSDDYVEEIITFIVPISTRITGHTGRELSSIGVKCKSSDSYDYIGPSPASPVEDHTFMEPDGIKTLEGRAGWGMVGFDAGHNELSGAYINDPADDGYHWVFTCDTPIREIHGSVGGDYIDPKYARISKLGFLCQS